MSFLRPPEPKPSKGFHRCRVCVNSCPVDMLYCGRCPARRLTEHEMSLYDAGELTCKVEECLTCNCLIRGISANPDITFFSRCLECAVKESTKEPCRYHLHNPLRRIVDSATIDTYAVVSHRTTDSGAFLPVKCCHGCAFRHKLQLWSEYKEKTGTLNDATGEKELVHGTNSLTLEGNPLDRYGGIKACRRAPDTMPIHPFKILFKPRHYLSVEAKATFGTGSGNVAVLIVDMVSNRFPLMTQTGSIAIPAVRRWVSSLHTDRDKDGHYQERRKLKSVGWCFAQIVGQNDDGLQWEFDTYEVAQEKNRRLTLAEWMESK